MVRGLLRKVKEELRSAVKGHRAPVHAPSAPAVTTPSVAVAASSATARPAPKPGGLAAAAAAAAASGMSTATTFRAKAPGEREVDEEHEPEDTGIADNGTADRVIGSTVYDEEVRTADDGETFWGPLDNPSARAKARGERLDIDRNECIGCGTCVEHIDTVFWLNNEEGKAYVLKQEGAMDRIEDAIDACPVTCISWQADAETGEDGASRAAK